MVTWERLIGFIFTSLASGNMICVPVRLIISRKLLDARPSTIGWCWVDTSSCIWTGIWFAIFSHIKSINRRVASFTLSSSFSEPLTSTSDECSLGRVEKMTCTLNSFSTSLTYGVSLSGGVFPGASIGSSNEINSGVEIRTRARARSTPSKLPHRDTWLLFSVGLDRFESGKWMWVAVSSMMRLMLLPPRPMMNEWSVYDTSIFMITRLPRESNRAITRSFAFSTSGSRPTILMWGSFLLLAPIFSRHGQLTYVVVSFMIFVKNSSALFIPSEYVSTLIISSSFWRSTLNRSTCRSSGLATPSWAAISRRSPQSLSTDEISLPVVSLGGPPLMKMCLLNGGNDDAIMVLFR